MRKHIYDETSVTLTCEGYEFKAKGKTVVQDGWKAIERCFKETLKSKEKDEPERSLPSLNEKDILSSVDSSVTEHLHIPAEALHRRLPSVGYGDCGECSVRR